MNIAVFASGKGTNFQTLIDKQKAGLLTTPICMLYTDNPHSFSIKRAEENQIPAICLKPGDFSDRNSYTKELLSILRAHNTDVIVLAGYLKKIPNQVISEYDNRIINIHPSLLPAFGGKGMYGMHVHEAVLAHGVKLSGITIHFVNEIYDQGPVIFQAVTKVLDCDTPASLASRVAELEYDSYWRVIEAIAQGKLKLEGRLVRGCI